MEDKATMQSNGAAQLNEELRSALRSVLSTFVCGGSYSYRQLPQVKYKAKSVQMWSLLQEYGWKKVAQKKGADWTFVLNRKSKSFTNRIDRKRGGSHFQKCFNMEYQHGMPTKSINEVLEYNKKYWVERDLPLLKANLKVWVKNELTTSKNWKV